MIIEFFGLPFTISAAYKNLREARGGYKGQQDHCRDLEERHAKHLYGFSHVPSPDVGQVDIAAIFIDRDKFVASKKFISKLCA